MLKKAFKIILPSVIITSSVIGADFNAQAEKDRVALIKYFETKFKDPAGQSDKFFPYSDKNELKTNYIKGLKKDQFANGTYAYAKAQREQYLEIIDMPPYDDNIDAGEELYNDTKGLKQCFPEPIEAAVNYPKFDDKKGEVITLSVAINDCLKQNGQKPWKMTKGKMADLEAYFASSARDEEKVINVKIQSKAAQEAYEAGKKYYYSQRGYLKLSCATCHVQGAGQKVRSEYMSSLLGHTTHFPVYRLKWEGLGTLERRVKGCIKDEGQKPPKLDSNDMKNLIYFISYMSNGMKIDGPDVRK